VRVSVFTEDGVCLWEFEDKGEGRSAGLTCPAFLPDVVSALQIAVTQAEGQLGSGFDEVDAALDIGAPAAKIYGDIPIPRIGNDNPHGEHSVMAAVISKSTSGPVVAEINIIRKKHIAFMRAINDDDVSSL
jgi:hypothetical protein